MLNALSVFIEIISAGIKLVTLADQMVYSRESIKENWTQLIISLAIMSRYHEESAIKADRLRTAWVKKRQGMETTKLMAKCPSWLQLSEDRTHFVVLEEKAAVIRRIFGELADGVGRGSIARRLRTVSRAPQSGAGNGLAGSLVRSPARKRPSAFSSHPVSCFRKSTGRRWRGANPLVSPTHIIIRASLTRLSGSVRRNHPGRVPWGSL